MKSALFFVAACSVLSVAFLCSMRTGSAFANCPGTNDIFLSYPWNVNAAGDGSFEYDITIEGWDLTFAPWGAIIEVWDSWFVDTEELRYEPDAIFVSGLPCEWRPNPQDYEVIQVSGVLDDPCDDGAIISEVKVIAQAGNPSYSEYALTGVLATATGCP